MCHCFASEMCAVTEIRVSVQDLNSSLQPAFLDLDFYNEHEVKASLLLTIRTLVFHDCSGLHITGNKNHLFFSM